MATTQKQHTRLRGRAEMASSNEFGTVSIHESRSKKLLECCDRAAEGSAQRGLAGCKTENRLGG